MIDAIPPLINSERKKILFVSNAPWVGSGYGVQTKLFSRAMQSDGYEVTNFGFFGHKGPQTKYEGILTLPMSDSQNGEDMIAEHQRVIKPDVTLVLYDLWTYEPKNLETWDCAVWAPIDHDPVPPFVTRRMDYMRSENLWTMTKWAQVHLRSKGYDSVYVPHGVDTDVYKPVDRDEARRKLEIDDDLFLAAMVGANLTYPARKSFDVVFKAWARLIQRHPKSLLYVHSWAGSERGGHDLLAMARFYGIEHHIRFPNRYAFTNHQYTDTHINWLYNAADVLVMPSRTEGFGVPAVEAQAAGCPVIVSDFGAQSELGEAGYKVRIDDDDKLYTYHGSEMCNPRAGEILLQLEVAHFKRTNKKVRERAREFAQQYDYRLVWSQHMKPAIEQLIEIERERNRRSNERRNKTIRNVRMEDVEITGV